jgi:3-oxoacyl-[acyl-carrier protein] reductase
MNPFDFHDQIVLVSGATSGIGRATALAFAQCGATVFAIGTSHEKGAEVVAKAHELTGRDAVIFHAADVSQKAFVDSAVAELLARFGKIDVVVNSAGICRDSLLLRMKADDWQKVLDVNLNSCFYVCQAALFPMLKARRGRMINISSISGIVGNAGQANYAASKAGMIGFSKSLAREVASRNILVNCIAPGFIETPMTDFLQGEKKDALLEEIPLKRMGTPEEVASCALFLASPFASYITGSIITVDGGLAM